MFEEYEVVGFRKVDFKDKDDKQVSGHTLYLQRVNPDVIGIETVKQFISSRIDYSPALGDTIRLVYNRYGKIAQIMVL